MDGFRSHRSHATAYPIAGMTWPLKPAKASLPCHSNAGKWASRNLWEAVQQAKIIMDGFRSHRSHVTAHPIAGMTWLLKPAKASLPCHSNAGKWASRNLWEAVQQAKIIMDGFRSHRSHATTHPSAGMTWPLKPASYIARMTYLLRSAIGLDRLRRIMDK